MKLVDEIAPREKLVEAAKAMIAGGLKATKPWDQKGWKPEGAARVFSPAGFQLWPAANALYRKETYDNYPGARYLLQSVFEGLQLPMDAALKVESRYFAHVLQTKEAAAMIRSLFVSMQELEQGRAPAAGRAAAQRSRSSACSAPASWAPASPMSRRRPASTWCCSTAIMPSAEKGKAHSDELIAKAVQRGRATRGGEGRAARPHHADRRLRRPRRLPTSSSRRCSRIAA